MIKKSILSVFFSFCLFCLSAQEEVRNLKSFSAINVSQGIQVDIYKGKPRAEINMIKGDIEDLIIDVSGSEVTLKFKKKPWSIGWKSSNNRKVEIDLYYDQEIEDISVSSGASVHGNDVMSGDDIDISVSSGASVDLEVDYMTADVGVSSGASLSLEGEAKELEVDVSSGASYRGAKLKAKKVDVDASSGASAGVWATDSLSGDASSGASIRYKGNPSKTNLNSGKWSGGSISKL